VTVASYIPKGSSFAPDPVVFDTDLKAPVHTGDADIQSAFGDFWQESVPDCIFDKWLYEQGGPMSPRAND
jgi:hypothetical protein